jgi:hypothetical protein
MATLRVAIVPDEQRAPKINCGYAPTLWPSNRSSQTQTARCSSGTLAVKM